MNGIEGGLFIELPEIVSTAPMDRIIVEENDDESGENLTSNQCQPDSLP